MWKPSNSLPRQCDADDDDYKYLMFGDSLVTVSDTGRELGEFTVTIEPVKRDEQHVFLIHANSHGAIDGVPCGTSITAYVSKKLETIEQQHHEYVKLENHPLDRKTFIVKQDDGFVINRVITQGEDVQRTAQTYKFDDMAGFISEGSNLLLQRLFIKKGVPDLFECLSFDSDLNLCTAPYRALEERKQIVDNQDIVVHGIERTINSISDLPTTWQSYFTKDGHLTNRVQVGSPVTMRLTRVPTPIEPGKCVCVCCVCVTMRLTRVPTPIEPGKCVCYVCVTMRLTRVPTPIEPDEEPEKPTFGKQPLNWEEDMEMYSKFLDRKEQLVNDHTVYMKKHPELKALLADFTQFLLLRKPDDVISFAADYFSSFSTTMKSASPYLKSAEPTMFPMSRTNTKIEKLAQVKASGNL
ncbi:ciliogenesis-associated TTC17-interacting protein-like [Lingula anatina]|uniref:Ciliogenesis-associated TTC17-interacting protein n=1 Tax=Lingula anatina TaxID=7574 RepID=A0A1S3HUC9_LINAN|nr:ciliogenesis-associated TTC17-interacting protein-like [Lingula anatina]|eukprot:XP_013388664.1 ciliogenesis-associated TTC17-interacting protein-like [Lingula anatina]